MRNKLKKIILGLITVASISTPLQAFAHDAYFLGVTIDTGTNRYMGTVAYDNNTLIANNHKEAKIAGFYSPIIMKDEFKLPKVDRAKVGNDAKLNYTGLGVSSGDGDLPLIYTFPSKHTRTVVGGCTTDANSKDMDRAYWVNDTLVTSLNDALVFVMSNSNCVPKNVDTQSFMQLAVDLANTCGNGSGKFTFNSVEFTVTKGYNKPANGLVSDDYIQISSKDIKATPFIYKVPKGYYPGQDLDTNLPKEYEDKISENDVEFLTWKHIVLQGNYNYEVNGTSYAKVTEILKPDKFSQAISDLLNFILGTVRSALGLFTFQELMLNQGVRSSNYLFGVMPYAWYKSAQTLHFVCQVIAWVLIIGALVKLLISRNIASINTSMRVNLMDGIQNIIFTMFLLTLIVPLFQVLCSLNAKLVDVFANASMYSDMFGNMLGTSSGIIGSIIINIMYFFVMCYFNFVYIIRGITVALLYGTAPLFVCSIAFGGKYKQLFGNFLKELVSNIFLQTFHAICLAFFATVSINGGARGIESLVLAYSFIPLTQFFRTNLMGLSGSTGDKLAGSALSTGAGIATGLISGSKQKKSGQNSGGANSSSSSSTSSSANSNSIKTNSSDKLRNKTGGGNIRSVNGGANDEIPNSQLTKLGKVGNIAGNVVNSKPIKALKSTGKFAGSVGKMALGTGMALGGSAIGSNELAKAGTRSMASGVGGAMGQMSNGFNNVKGKVGEAYANNSHVPQKEGHMYSQDLGNGTVDHKNGASGLEADTGIKDIVDTGNGMQYELGGKFNPDTNTFDYGKYDDDGKFVPNNDLNGTEAHKNLNEMIQSFATDDKEAINYYKKQGINDLGYNADTGSLIISANKGYAGVNKVNKSGNSYIINKNNMAPVSMKNVANVPSYADHCAKMEANKEKQNN